MLQENNETLVVTQTMSAPSSMGSYAETISLLEKTITARVENIVFCRGELRSVCDRYAEKECAVTAELNTWVGKELRALLQPQQATLKEIGKIRILVDTHDRAELAFFSEQVDLIRKALIGWISLDDLLLHQYTELLENLSTVLQ